MSDWQPIETAPKDEDDLLLFYCEKIIVGRWSSDLNAWIVDEPYCLEQQEDFTHWMPLPEPPSLTPR